MVIGEDRPEVEASDIPLFGNKHEAFNNWKAGWKYLFHGYTAQAFEEYEHWAFDKFEHNTKGQ